MKTKRTEARRRLSEASFTLIETVIALAIVTFLIVEVSAVQGQSIVFSEYGRNVTLASWLARRVMAQVEYNYHTKPFKELITSNVTDQKFDDFEDYTYSLEIKEWKFPFVKMLQNALGGTNSNKEKKDDTSTDDKTGTLAKQAKDGADSAAGDAGSGQIIETVVKQIFGDEPIFLTARVDVSWSEGAQRNAAGITYLMTNQSKLDEALIQLKPVYDKLTKPAATNKNGKTNPTNPTASPTPAPGADGGDGSTTAGAGGTTAGATTGTAPAGGGGGGATGGADGGGGSP